MLTRRRAADRGFADHGWLKTFHTFSFSSYIDPRHTRFRTLRVMNEDTIAPGQGFGTHPHHDMEIVTYVLSGELEHRDSMGNGEVLRAGEFQRMTAGSGITHSEFNPSADTPTHLYQIWLFPERKGLEPSYEQRAFAPDDRRDRWRLVASRGAEEGSLHINQDARIYLADVSSGAELTYGIGPSRHLWLQVLKGRIQVHDLELDAGDGLAASDEPSLLLKSVESAELMLFDLA